MDDFNLKSNVIIIVNEMDCKLKANSVNNRNIEVIDQNVD